MKGNDITLCSKCRTMKQPYSCKRCYDEAIKMGERRGKNQLAKQIAEIYKRASNAGDSLNILEKLSGDLSKFLIKTIKENPESSFEAEGEQK